MKDVHIAVGVVTIALNAVAAVLGAYGWWRVRHGTAFWRVLRAGQVAIVLEAALGGVLDLVSHKAPSLHVIYGVLPIVIAFFAEQFRVASAQMILDARGFQSAAEVGKLPEDEQQAIVRAILQREMGVMTLSVMVNIVLLARAAGTA